MKNKRLTILIIILLAAAAIFFYDKYKDKMLPVKLTAEDITEIEIRSDDLGAENGNTLTLSGEDDTETIREIAELFNQSEKHPDQGIGTTHPTSVSIKDGTGNIVWLWCGTQGFITVADDGGQYNYVNDRLDDYIEKILEPLKDDTPEEYTPEVRKTAGKSREIYSMDGEDTVDDLVPNPGDFFFSSGVSRFLSLDLPDDHYMIVRINIYFGFEPFEPRGEYEYEGKILTEWREDPLAAQYDFYVTDFKELYHETEEYCERKEKGEWDLMYREYLESIADEQNDIGQIIKAYDQSQKALEAYDDARSAYISEIAEEIYGNECARLKSCGLDVTMEGGDRRTGYCLIGEFSHSDIENFSAGDYGYILSLPVSAEAINE